MTLEPRFESALIEQVIRHGLAEFLESTRNLVCLLDVDGSLLASNPAFERLRGASDEADAIIELVAPEQRKEARSCMSVAWRDQRPVRSQLRFRDPLDGISYDCLFVPGEGNTILFFGEPAYADEDLGSANERMTAELARLRDALDEKTSELSALRAQVDELAYTDSLTFVPNRRSIIATLQRHVTYADRYGAPLAVSMLDLDGFKAVNDSLGHRAGDSLLSLVARQLREHIREPDEIGRYGGDEFLLVLPNSGAAGASEQATRLCEHLRERPFRADGTSADIRLSVGIAQFTPGVDTWQSLLERADRALLEAKRLGGDQWVILDA